MWSTCVRYVFALKHCRHTIGYRLAGFKLSNGEPSREGRSKDKKKVVCSFKDKMKLKMGQRLDVNEFLVGSKLGG